MHAGLYVLAPVSTNECAEFSTRITDVDACRAVAPLLGRTFSVSGTFVSAPRGCYIITTTGAVWFNAHATGAAAADKQLVCYTGTPSPTDLGDTNPPTRAPTFAPTRGPNFADPAGTRRCAVGSGTQSRRPHAAALHCATPRCLCRGRALPVGFVFQHGALTAAAACAVSARYRMQAH